MVEKWSYGGLTLVVMLALLVGRAAARPEAEITEGRIASVDDDYKSFELSVGEGDDQKTIEFEVGDRTEFLLNDEDSTAKDALLVGASATVTHVADEAEKVDVTVSEQE
ncbi:MAG: hypothetical protein IT442_02050 [Phycisphaeraceae bacterium]|nr:hypothetical protein [Phycisphaeraceae bacterium]